MPVALEFVTCLSEMKVDGEGSNVLEYTRVWIEKVNRGGLYPLNEAFVLCVSMEKCVRVFYLNICLGPHQKSVVKQYLWKWCK